MGNKHTHLKNCTGHDVTMGLDYSPGECKWGNLKFRNGDMKSDEYTQGVNKITLFVDGRVKTKFGIGDNRTYSIIWNGKSYEVKDGEYETPPVDKYQIEKDQREKTDMISRSLVEGVKLCDRNKAQIKEVLAKS